MGEAGDELDDGAVGAGRRLGLVGGLVLGACAAVAVIIGAGAGNVEKELTSPSPRAPANSGIDAIPAPRRAVALTGFAAGPGYMTKERPAATPASARVIPRYSLEGFL